MTDDENREQKIDHTEIPELKDDDEEMGNIEGTDDGDIDMGATDNQGEIEGMVMSLHPDQAVRDSIFRIRDKVEKAKRSKSWKDGINEMNEALKREGIDIPIMEVYSPPRVNGMANALGLASGLSLDLTELDPDDGMP